ncbi:MAG: hypothetical protein R3Y44_07495 [Rikenellaceae bacterium]
MVKRSVAERRRYLELFRTSGESIVGFCRTQGINDKTFGNWLREERLGMTLGEYRKLRRSEGVGESKNTSKSRGKDKPKVQDKPTDKDRPTYKSKEKAKSTSSNNYQHTSKISSTAPIISPIAIVPSEEFSQAATSIPHLTLHLPSGVRAEIINIATRQIGELMQSLLHTDSSTTTSDSRCSH